jgi:hypothetical protein
MRSGVFGFWPGMLPCLRLSGVGMGYLFGLL